MKTNVITIRFSEEELKELDNFIKRWEEKGAPQMDRSKHMRKAITNYIDLNDYDLTLNEGNIVLQRFNQEKYKVSTLFELAKEIQEQLNNTEDEDKKYLLKKIYKILTGLIQFEIDCTINDTKQYAVTKDLNINKREG